MVWGTFEDLVLITLGLVCEPAIVHGLTLGSGLDAGGAFLVLDLDLDCLLGFVGCAFCDAWLEERRTGRVCDGIAVAPSEFPVQTGDDGPDSAGAASLSISLLCGIFFVTLTNLSRPAVVPADFPFCFVDFNFWRAATFAALARCAPSQS